MRYPAEITEHEDDEVVAEFPGCPGLVTGSKSEEIEAMALDAMTGWLEVHLDNGNPIPRPRKPVRGKRVIWVEVPARLAKRIERAWARAEG